MQGETCADENASPLQLVDKAGGADVVVDDLGVTERRDESTKLECRFYEQVGYTLGTLHFEYVSPRAALVGVMHDIGMNLMLICTPYVACHGSNIPMWRTW
jgi:hypothetical protein